MLPEIVWSMPRLGTMNLHASLLPAYRGAAPINWAIIKGEKKTGLTTFLLEHAIDTGQIISQREMPILDDDDAGTLHDRVMSAGAGLVLGSVDLIASGHIKTRKQDDLLAGHAPKIHHEDGHIRWDDSVKNIINLIRGMAPYPGAWTIVDGKQLKVFKAREASGVKSKPAGSISIEKGRFLVQAGDGEVEILSVQLEGKRRMETGEFLRGFSFTAQQVT
jgi:methionyl-tRNA formyltransferase